MRLKKILSLLIAMIMALGCVSIPVMAEETDVAKIDGESYATLADALTVANAMEGDVTVEIYDKVTLNTSISGSYDSIKFVGMEEDAEIYLDVQGYITATGKAVAFENLTLSKSEGGFITNAGFMNVAFGVYDVNEVTYTNCTFTNGAYASSGENTFTGCTFKRSHEKYGLWAYGNVDCTVDGCTFADYRGIKMYAEGAAKTTELTVTHTDFSALDSKPAIVLTYGESVTLENNTYSSTGVFELDLDGAPNGTSVTSDVAPTCKNDNGACGVLVDGKIYTTVADAAEVATSGSTVTLLHNSTETVEFAEGVNLDKNGYTAENVKVEGNTSTTAVAKIGEDYFASLQAAINAAQDGDTITVLADINLANTELQLLDGSYDTYFLVEGKTVTIDLNGKTVSGAYSGSKMLVGVFSTDKNGHLTITGNGTVDVTATNEVYALVANYNPGCSITIENGTYKLDKAHDSLIFHGGNTDAAVTVNGGTFTLGNVGTGENGKPWIFNVVGAGDHHVLVKGGTFNADINRQYWSSEAVVDENCYTVENEDGTYTVKEGAVAYVETGMTTGPYFAPKNIGYPTLTEAIAAATARKDSSVVLIKDIVGVEEFDINVVDEAAIVLDLNEHILNGAIKPSTGDITIKNGSIVNKNGGYSGIEITSGKLTLEDVNIDSARHAVRIDGAVEAVINGGTYKISPSGKTQHAVNVSGAANVTIKNGTFTGPKGTSADSGSAVNAQTGSIVIIEGGNFSGGKNDTLGVSGTLTVSGGTFDQNPTAYVAEGYAALADLNGNYVVGTKPTATVNKRGATVITAGNYTTYGGGSNAVDMPLSFVMQFLADQTEADMETSPYADWYADFVITFDGLKSGSFVADGCYLAGFYGDFGWVKVPVDGMTIEDGVRYPVMLGVGLGQKYDYVCSGVQDFKCALYLTPEVLEANPNIKVNLELAVVDNSKGEEAATTALVNNKNIHKAYETSYTAENFKGYVAQIGDVKYTTLEAAIEAAQEKGTIILLDNVTEDVTINKSITLDGGKFDYTGTMTIADNKTVTIQNVNFVKGCIAESKGSHGKLTVKDCDFDGVDGSIGYAISVRGSDNVVIEKCNAKNYSYGMLYIPSSVAKISVKDVNVSDVTAAFNISYSGDGSFENVKVSKATYGFHVQNYGARTFTLTGCEFDCDYPIFIQEKGAANVTFSLEGANNLGTDTFTVSNYAILNLADADATLTACDALKVTTDLEGYIVKYVDGIYKLVEAVAQIGDTYYENFADALNAVQDGETITLRNVTGSELSKEIEFTKEIAFTITGDAPNYALPVVTFQNTDVTIKDAEILIPELDARQNATINVVDSIVHDAGGNSIVKSYYNGAINISGTSVVHTMQVTTMGYITISDTAELNATWQTNVYGNGMITVEDNATFATAALHLTGKDYSNRDNTDADRVGKPAAVVVDGANFIVGKVYSDNGADYSYNSSKGINIGTIDGKSALLDIKNGATVNVYMANDETANIGANGTVNVSGSAFNVACRAENGTVTLANNGAINVSGTSDIAATKVTGTGWVYMNGVTLDADTKLIGAKVRFASGTNNVEGSVIDDGFFQVGIGAYNGIDANVDTENGVTVNVKNAKIGSNGDTYAGWIGTGFYDTDAEKAAAMTDAKYILNIENSIAEFGYLHISNDGELKVNGNAAKKAWYNNSDYSFYSGDLIINGVATFDATDVLALYTKVSCDNGTDKPGTLNIVNGTEYEAERHNGAIGGTNFDLRKNGVVNVENAKLYIGEYTSIAADAVMNIGGEVTALGTITNNGKINLTTPDATLTTPEDPVVDSAVDDYEVVYDEGKYGLKEIEKAELFEFYKMNLDLESSMKVNFYISANYFVDTNYYAEIVHSSATGENKCRVDFAEWKDNNSYKQISYTELVAKNMADRMTITIYDGNGKQVSVAQEASIKTYAETYIKENAGTGDKWVTSLVDMLNYGAEAQIYFNYNIENLANADIDDYQKYATQQDVELENIADVSEHVYQANLDLENRIVYNGYFENVTSDMTAEVSYTNHVGKLVTDSVSIVKSGSYYKVAVNTLVIADANQLITITIKDSNGEEYAYIKDTVNSYLYRAIKAESESKKFEPLAKAMAKFTASAYTALHEK